MTEKRFTLAYEKGNWWAVRDGDITLWKEEVIYLLNELHEENEQLKKDKKFVGVLANHRGEMVGFATALIEDMGSKEMMEMWDNFKGKMYQKWKGDVE